MISISSTGSTIKGRTRREGGKKDNNNNNKTEWAYSAKNKKEDSP